MEKLCPICDYPLKNGDKVVACMVSTYVEIPSTNTFAIEHPTQCLEICHVECYDDYEDDEPGENGQ